MVLLPVDKSSNARCGAALSVGASNTRAIPMKSAQTSSGAALRAIPAIYPKFDF